LGRQKTLIGFTQMAQIPNLQSTNTLGVDDQAILRQGTIDKRIGLNLAGILSWARRNGYSYLGEHTTGTQFPDIESFTTFQGKTYFVNEDVTLPYSSTSNDPSVDDNLHVSEGVSKTSITKLTNLVVDSVADVTSGAYGANKVKTSGGEVVSLTLGQVIYVEDYYGGASPSDSGTLFCKVVATGTGTHDGGRYIDISGGTYQLQQQFANDIPTLKQYGGKSEGQLGYDSYPNAQRCIDYNSSMIIDQSNVGYLFGDSLDLTNRQSGVSIICNGHVGINNLGTYIYGNTGEYPILDTTGSQRNYFHNFGLKSATNNSNPSKVGCLFARSDTVQYAQFNILSNFISRMDTDDAAFGGKGSVGIVNLASEIMTFRDVYGIGNTGCFIGSSNYFNVQSKYATLNTSISSTSTFTFEGTTVFDSNGTVGTPLHCVGAQVGSATGTIYLNGRGGTAGDIGAGGFRFEGGCTNWDVTFFLEFTLHVGYIENGFRDNKIRVLGAINENRYILTNSGFTGVNSCDFTFESTISGAITPPDYVIQGESTDVYRDVYIKTPYNPAVDFIAPVSATNRVNCNLEGESGSRNFTFNKVASPEYLITGSNNNTYSAGIYHIAGVSPEGEITANPGSIATANIATAGSFYVKTSGTGNTGWTLK